MHASRADAALRRIGGSQPPLRYASSARGWGEWGEWAAIGGVHALRWQRMGSMVVSLLARLQEAM